MEAKKAHKKRTAITAACAVDPNTLTVVLPKGKTRERAISELSMSSTVSNANTVRSFSKTAFGELNMDSTVDALQAHTDKVKAGDLSELEATLTAQAVSLDAIFNELARRAASNMGAHLHATEVYLRMALKAQAQCRATIETLVEVKYPKAATFVRQQNVAYQQQVNNGDLPA